MEAHADARWVLCWPLKGPSPVWVISASAWSRRPKYLVTADDAQTARELLDVSCQPFFFWSWATLLDQIPRGPQDWAPGGTGYTTHRAGHLERAQLGDVCQSVSLHGVSAGSQRSVSRGRAVFF